MTQLAAGLQTGMQQTMAQIGSNLQNALGSAMQIDADDFTRYSIPYDGTGSVRAYDVHE